MSTSAASMGGKAARHHWIVYIILSIPCLMIYVILAFSQLKTDEAPFMGGHRITTMAPDWSLFLQIPHLLMGQLDPSQQWGALVGWFCFSLYLVCVFAFDLAKDSLKSWKLLIPVFLFLVGVNVLWDFYTDIFYGMPLGTNDWLGVVVFTFVQTGGVLFFGAIGINFLYYGLTHRN